VNNERVTKVKGAFWSKAKSRWVVRLWRDGERHEIGQFKTQIRARNAYDLAAAGDMDAARGLYEVEKRENIEREREASKERLAARRAEKILRDGHPYAMLYPFAEVEAKATVRYRGQLFQSLGQCETVSGRNRHRINVDLWETCCATCGAPFVFNLLPKRDGSTVPFWPVRRCETHRRAGASVRAGKLHWRAAVGPEALRDVGQDAGAMPR
jgi:hypothetical protein